MLKLNQWIFNFVVFVFCFLIFGFKIEIFLNYVNLDVRNEFNFVWKVFILRCLSIIYFLYFFLVWLLGGLQFQ